MSEGIEIADSEIRDLLETIYLKYGNDFRNYTPASVRRRISLAIQRLGYDSARALTDRVREESRVFDQLLQYMTVPTSEMFRDPDFYRALREEVVPFLRTYPSLKIWIAGCSTGEELYSIAILLREEGLLERTLIYATDLNPVYLQAAQAGIYTLENVRKYTTNYQKAGGKAAFADYYQTGFGSAIFDASLRERVVFADHSLATDSVFAEVQLVTCRNVLIYFNRALQDRAFRLFRDSLSHRGFLGIGAKETIRFSSVRDDFDEFSAKDRIYRKLRSA